MLSKSELAMLRDASSRDILFDEAPLVRRALVERGLMEPWVLGYYRITVAGRREVVEACDLVDGRG